MVFIKGRQIMDAAFIVNEVIKSIVSQNKPSILYKLDNEKAYDYVNW